TGSRMKHAGTTWYHGRRKRVSSQVRTNAYISKSSMLAPGGLKCKSIILTLTTITIMTIMITDMMSTSMVSIVMTTMGTNMIMTSKSTRDMESTVMADTATSMVG